MPEPEERHVDLILVENRESDSGLALMVATGHSAGWLFLFMPMTARFKGREYSISVAWLRDNWDTYIGYRDSTADQVLIAAKGYAVLEGEEPATSRV